MIPPLPRRTKLELVDAAPLSPSVRALTFDTTDRAPFEWIPGQYLALYVPGTPIVSKRDYSIACAPDPDAPSRLEIAVTRVEDGPASIALHELAVGSEIEAFGPQGAFVLRPEPGVPILFVAAGTGLAPIRAMIQRAIRSSDTPPMTLLFGCRNESNLLWGEELTSLAATLPERFRFEPTLSRGGPTWPGRRGHVQAHLDELAARGSTLQAYVCGLRAMTDEVTARLVSEHHIEQARVFTEEYD